ncbi:uncharacterized protein [Dermacentor andersoni]|uniref:uncharacterized protein n=1 Tax=Dermacentor andersoni TaxID=34620 RepID=UPI002416071F|nr:uncharacterized protein LOC126541161 [Dermacentor andersoni]
MQVYLFKQGTWCTFILLPLLVVMGVTWALRRAPDSHWKLDIATTVTTEVLGKFPVPEVVSCVNCSSSAPTGGRLVWRAVSNAGHEALLEFPDLLRDAYAIWAPCPRLTVLVTSAPERRAQRDAIRTTWGRPDRHSNCSHRVVFFTSAQSRTKQYSDLRVCSIIITTTTTIIIVSLSAGRMPLAAISNYLCLAPADAACQIPYFIAT